MGDSNSGRHFGSPADHTVPSSAPSSLPRDWDSPSSAATPDAGASGRPEPGSTEEFMALVDAASPDPAAVPSTPVPVSSPATADEILAGAETAPATEAKHALASSSVPAPSSASASSTAPVNPLVAARAAVKDPDARKKSPAAPTPVEELYPIADHPAGAAADDGSGKAFDTSFGEGGGLTRRGLLITLVAVVVIALVVSATYFVNRSRTHAKAVDNLNAAIARISDADAVIAPLDQAIASEISTSDVSEDLTNAMMSSTTATNALSEASSLVDEAAQSRSSLTDEQTAALDACRVSISSRRDMLKVGGELLKVDSSVSKALQSLDSAYAGIADANDKVKQSEDTYLAYAAAVSANEDTSAYDLWANVDLDNVALTDITNAQASVEQAKSDYADADYSALETYLAARVTALQLLVQYDTCVANGDDDGASAVLDDYNAANDAMNAAAASVPADGRTLVRAAYAATTSEQSRAYEQARSSCAAADATIRAYLGEDGAPSLDAPATDEGTSASSASDDAPAAEAAAPAADETPAQPADAQAPADAASETPAEGAEAEAQA